MQTTVNIGVLQQALPQASFTLDSRASSIGSWIRIMARTDKGLYIYSDNQGTSRTLIKVEANVIKEGEAIVLPKLLAGSLLGLPADEDVELMLSPSGAKLLVKYGSVKAEIAIHADAPKTAEVLKTIPFNAKSSFTVSAASLVNVVNRTIFCAATSTESISEGPWLSSVLLGTRDSLVMATATNRIIGGQAEVPDEFVTGDYTLGVHRDALVALKALLSKRQKEEVSITIVTAQGSQPNEVLFRFSDVILGVRQLSKPYPTAVSKIFITPGTFNSTRVDRKVLLSSFLRMSAFAEQNTFTINFAGDKLTLTSKGHSSTFQEQVGATKMEGNVTVGLGIASFVSCLTAMEGEEVVIKYASVKDHIHLQEGDLNFKYVISPVTVEWEKKGK